MESGMSSDEFSLILVIFNKELKPEKIKSFLIVS